MGRAQRNPSSGDRLPVMGFARAQPILRFLPFPGVGAPTRGTRMTSIGFPDKKVIADLTARTLLEVGAVQFMADKPFIFTSGWASPVYTDCRRLISFPRVRRTLIDFGASTVLRDAGFEQFDAVAGGETAGIPFAAWMADKLGLPMLYVRKKAKGFGRNAQIEGHFAA